MSEKKLQTRIINKNDIEANWNKAINFIPKQGEIIIYNKDDNHDYVRFKIGDGLTAVIDLPFYQEVPIITTTLSASGWDSDAKTYSFEADYPSANYNIEVEIDGDNCTDEQLEAWIAARPLSSSTNKIIAKGDVPSVDIPVIIKVVKQ